MLAHQNQTTEVPSKLLSCYEVLDTFSISHVIKFKSSNGSRAIIDVNESTPLAEVLHTLKENNILAVPIYRTSPDYSAKIYTGIVSVHDILSFAYFQQIFDKDTIVSKDELSAAVNNFVKKQFFESPVKSILRRREEPVPFIFSSTDSITNLIKAFTVGGHHRVLVVDSDIMVDSLVGPIPTSSTLSIISQMDLVNYLYASDIDKTKLPPEFIQNIFTLPLSETHSPAKKKVGESVIAINSFQPALAAFNIMHLNNVHALPVINSNDKIIGTISVKNLRGITLENVDKLALTAMEFLEIEDPVDAAYNKHTLDTTNVSCSVEHAVQIMLQDRIHHVWTISQNSDIRGCVTLTDILYLFTKKVSK
ncbi:hypothetical protein HDV06_005639 [Boothiomyces sp. JEL0866]|nr:hypothetical protein HDV06_005639 [Boothiomyces sp. JEL0866]